MPEGYNLSDFNTFCNLKTFIIIIQNLNDNLCLPRALVVSMALVNKNANKQKYEK